MRLAASRCTRLPALYRASNFWDFRACTLGYAVVRVTVCACIYLQTHCAHACIYTEPCRMHVGMHALLLGYLVRMHNLLPNGEPNMKTLALLYAAAAKDMQSFCLRQAAVAVPVAFIMQKQHILLLRS